MFFVPSLIHHQSKLQDWRIKNVLQLLTDIRIVDGGRQISVFSPIEIVNRTQHKIQIASHVDPTQALPSSRESRGAIDYKAKLNDFMYEDIGPDETYHVPLFLIESALHLKGNHLGSLWIRPNTDDSIIQLLLRGSCTGSGHGQRSSIDFCSNPLQLARLISESSMLLSQPRYDDDKILSSLNTGLDLSCPITTDKGGSISRFCYCMEIRRRIDENPFDEAHASNAKIVLGDLHEPIDASIFKKKRPIETEPLIEKNDCHVKHGPVAYSLVLYPPIIIENLLPEQGRFELMHATRRQVLWFGDLSPGESVPIHTVGLDAPLLLLMNLGYCR